MDGPCIVIRVEVAAAVDKKIELYVEIQINHKILVGQKTVLRL